MNIINQPNSRRIVKFFDDLEEKIEAEIFIDLIPIILTNRNPYFNGIEEICFFKNWWRRMQIIFFWPYVSNQKPNAENINNKLEKIFSKGKFVDNRTKETVKKHNITLLIYKLNH